MISQIGRYKIIAEIGQGAMGMVYQAQDPLIDRIVAIKTINLEIADEDREEYEKRFYQEARAAGKLNHPNIVTIYDVGKTGDLAYMAMEFLEGQELRDIIRQQLLPVEQVLNFGQQIASGLAYAHEFQIVHRDIKPANIMLVRDNLIKITDFGIARMSSSAVKTQVGMVLGSPKYMSPEQVLGKTLDHRSDIFSLGVMLYQMLTGQAPFQGDTVNAVMYQTINHQPERPSAINSAVPQYIDTVVARAMAKNVKERYQSASSLAKDLELCSKALANGDTQIRAASSAETDVPKNAASIDRNRPDHDTETGEHTVKLERQPSNETDKTVKIDRKRPTAEPKHNPSSASEPASGGPQPRAKQAKPASPPPTRSAPASSQNAQKIIIAGMAIVIICLLILIALAL